MHPSDMKWLALAALALSLVCTLKPARADTRVVCPPEVDSTRISVGAGPGWVAFYRPGVKVRLLGARVWTGPLSDKAELVGESVVRKGRIISRFGPFTYGDDPHLDKWMVCEYADNIYQAMKLPIATRECFVTYRRGALDPSTKKPDYVVADITCR